MKRYVSLRWFLLAAGVVAIVGLTAMNVYSLYQLHESTIKADRQPKKLQVAEFTDKIRYRFFKPFWGISATNMDRLKAQFARNNQFTNEVSKRVHQAAIDSLYSSIYFVTPDTNPCRQHQPILRYSADKKKFIYSNRYPESLCSGMGKARTRMQALIKDVKYNNKIFFDSDKSATIVFVDPTDRSIFGYLVMPLNRQYLTEHYLPQKLQAYFGESQQSGMHIWLRDWTTNTVIASSHPQTPYNRNQIQFKQSFPNFFDNWKLEVTFTNTATIKASNASLTKNLFMLGGAFLILVGALVFMFTSAQKERALAERQAGFLANVTHELKTPLSVMQAAGENLADGRVFDQQRIKNYGSHIYDEAIRLRTMIEKLLDVAKADAGQSLIDPHPFDVTEALNTFITKHRGYIETKGFHLETAVADESLIANIDADSLQTILSYLVENAIKYSHKEKYIGIFLDTRDQHIRLRIEDHGVGMSREVQSNIFDKFYRAEETLTAKTKGHGLGLSIVKNLVELNSGMVSVQSTVGEGSIFEITFPIMADAQPEESHQELQYSSNQVQSVSLTQ